MKVHWMFDKHSLSVQWRFTEGSLNASTTLFTECSLNVHWMRAHKVADVITHWMFTECSLNVHWMFTEGSLMVHWRFTEGSLNVHWMFTEGSLKVHWRFTEGSLNVHWMFTEGSLKVHWRFTECAHHKVVAGDVAGGAVQLRALDPRSRRVPCLDHLAHL
jgi:hypothetical protein